MTATETTLKVKKTYTFGKYHDAEVVTLFGTKKSLAIRHDPVGTEQSVEKWCDDYATAHGIAKLHALMMNAKYN